MQETINIATAPKTATFQMRINPEVKSRLEGIYANCGMTLTDAINTFLQQSLNVEAITQLMLALGQGEDSVRTPSDWINEADILAEFAAES